MEPHWTVAERIVELPKGRYRLTCRWADAEVPSIDRGVTSAPGLAPEVTLERPSTLGGAPWRRDLNWKLFSAIAAVLAFTMACLNVYLLRRPVRRAASFESGSTRFIDPNSAVGQLWQPFLTSKRPVLLVAEDPLLIEFKKGERVFFRDPRLSSWDDATASSDVAALRKVFNNADVQPDHRYTSFAEARATFLIGRLFGGQDESPFSLVRESEVSHEEVADDHLLLIGVSPDAFAAELRSLSSQVELVPAKEGVQVLHPRPGELALYENALPTAREQGAVYALISHIPGPLHQTDIRIEVGRMQIAEAGFSPVRLSMSKLYDSSWSAGHAA